jgi:dihydroflavonol-4-reductase
MKVLVTGASGFIGGHLLPALIAEGHEVTTFGRGKENQTVSGVGHISGDITCYGEIREACVGKELVIHLAGLVSYRRADSASQKLVNVQGTENVMRACLEAGVKRVIHTSSIAALGIPGLRRRGSRCEFSRQDFKIENESFEYNLQGLGLSYCDTKREAEQVVQSYVAHGLNAVILNPGIIFGEGDGHSHHQTIFRALSRGFWLSVPAGGIPCSDIQDVIAAFLSATKNGSSGERYNLVSANLTYMDMAKIFASIYNCQLPLFLLPPLLVNFAGFISEEILSPLGLPCRLSRQMSFLSNYKIFFSSAKASAELGIDFTDFTSTVLRTAPYYLGKSCLK